MNSDNISREKLLEEIKRRRNQGIIGKVEAARWEKIVETFPDATAPAPEPAEIPEAKSLRWLANMFPWTENPQDETDRMTNAIHVYATAGADKIDAMAAAHMALPGPPPFKQDDPVPEILMFIGRFSTDGGGTRREVVEAFTRGGCFWFSYILAARFGQQYGAEIVTDYVANHFATRIAGRVYDITGDVTDAGTWEPWEECNDARLRERITQYCIMF